jgi:hypothetical protein
MKTRLLTITKHPDPRTRLICGIDKALSGGLIRIRGLCEVAPSAATQLTDGSQKSKNWFRPFISNSQKFVELVLTRNHGFF